jgi:hypothetical protein
VIDHSNYAILATALLCALFGILLQSLSHPNSCNLPKVRCVYTLTDRIAHMLWGLANSIASFGILSLLAANDWPPQFIVRLVVFTQLLITLLTDSLR